MEGGKLNRRVTIQSPTESKNSIGEGVKSWADVATVWAAIEPLSSRELLAQRREVSDVSTRIRIRYRSGVSAAMRVVHGSNVYRIDGAPIDVDGRGREMVLNCVVEDPTS